MISPAIYEELRKIATLKDPQITYQRGSLLIGSHDAAAIVEAVDLAATVRAMIASGVPITLTMLKAMCISPTETADIPRKMTEMTVHRD